MATNIEQIFRSFVVSKFREIQEQQFGSGKVGQQNGDINSSEEVNCADVAIGALQNDPLVQKIEQVLSEVLGAEPQYKPDAGQDTVKNKTRSTKRSIPDEVQDEIPRKKSKKDKKHKDKKKKKKRKKEKKEKKYKKLSKESKLNSDHKECGDIQPAFHLNPESLVLNAENVDVEPASPLKPDSQWFMEKTAYENLNSSLSNSHDASNSDTSKLDASEEDSVLISMQELCEGELTNERELENYTCQHTNLAVNLHVGDESLNTADAEGDDTRMKQIEQPEASSALQVAEYIDDSETSPKFVSVELEDLETRVESYSVEAKELDCLSESLDPESMAQPESVLFEKTGCKFIKTPLETNAEAKDSVTTLGFLAMVVGKDFEATSEFLNKAKVKASERSTKGDVLTDMKDELGHGSEKIAMMEDLEKTLQTQSGIEKKDLEGIPESVCIVTRKDHESSLAPKPKIWPEDAEGSTEPDECKHTETSLDPETTGVRKQKETQTSAFVLKQKDPLKYQKSLDIVADVKDLERAPDLEIIKRTDSGTYFLETEVETKHSEAAAKSEEVDVRCLRGTSVYESEKEEWGTFAERVMGMKNLGYVGASRVNYLEASLKTAVEKKRDTEVPVLETVVEMNVSETLPEIKNLETASETLDNSAKTQYLDVSKHLAVSHIEKETEVNLMDLGGKAEQPSMSLKKIEIIPETLYLTEMKHVTGVLQSDVMTQGKDSEINLKPEGQEEERDLDAASESLHMIFTNYSEHSLELYTEPEAMMEPKNSERVPELLHMEDANNSEALLSREVEDLKNIECAAVVKLNDLEKKMEYQHVEVKTREVDSKAVTDVEYLETLVPPEAATKRKDLKIVPYSVTEVKEKALDTTVYVGNDQNSAETAEWEIKSGSLKVKDITEKQPSAEIKSPLFISETFQEVNIISSEKTPEVDAIPVIQELKKPGEFIPVLDVDSPNKTSGLEVSAEDLESSQFVKTKDREINLESQHALEVKYTSPRPELLLLDELTNLQEKQKLEESTEVTCFTAVPDSPYASRSDMIVASESGEVNEVIDSKSLHMAQTISDNIMTSLYMIHPKDSKIISETEIMDAKDLEIEPESSHRAGIQTEDLPEYESVTASQFLEIIEESPKKNEMRESNTTFGNKELTVPGLEANSETMCVVDTENLEVVKKAHVPPMSQFTLGVIGIEGTPITVSAAEDKDLKTSKRNKTVEVKYFIASTAPADIVKETFDFALVTDTENLETNQILEANLESMDKKGVNSKLDSETAPNDSEIFKKHKLTVGSGITEDMLPILNKAEEKESGTDLKPEAALVEKYSESVCESVEVSESQDCDAKLSVFMVDVKDSELDSDFIDAGEVKAIKTALEFKTTPEPLCELQLGNLDNVVESLLTTGMKDLRETLNCEVVLEAKDLLPPATNLNTSELKSSESVCMLEITNSEEILELTTPTYQSSAHLKSSDTAAEIESLNIIEFETPLKSETEVKYFESVSETDCVLEPFDHKAVPESEYISEERVSETASEAICMKPVGDLETKLESKHASERKDIEPVTQSTCTVQAKCVEESLVYEVQDDSQFSGTMEIEDLGGTTSVVGEMGKNSDKELQLHFLEKCSETAIECTHMPDSVKTHADMEPVCRAERKYSEPIAEMACVVDNKNLEANSGFMSVTELKDTAFVKSKTSPELIHLAEAIPKCESLVKVKDVQIVQSPKEGIYFERSSESLLVLEKQDLEKDSTSVPVSEAVSEESLKSVPAVKAEVSEAAHKYMNAKGIDISEQNSECVCLGEVKGLSSVPEHAELAQAENSETSAEVTLELKNLEATSETTTLVSLEEQIVKASLKPVCGAEENNLVASQHIIVEVKDSEAALEPVKIAEKAQETTSCISLKDQHSEPIPESSEITKENDESISKDRKSEKVSSKTKDKTKSGKKAKKSRSKSPSKSKKRKKKSRSRSTSRQISSRRARSKSKNDSDSRKKHSSSRRKSRSKSAERKEGKESSLRSRRRRSRTSDRHKSRSKSVDKRESSLRSRRRRSRSSDRRKSRSKSVDRRESVRTRRRLSRSSDNHKSRSKSVDKRETLIRSRWRRSRSSDHHKSRSRSTDKKETSTRTRRRRSRSSDNHKSRSRSADKRETPVRRKRRRSRSSDNYKSRSKSVDRRESSVRSRRRWSRSSDHHKSRSRSVDDKREISVRTRRKRSRSSENRRSRSKSVDKRESLRTRRRRSRSSDNRKSRSRSVNKETLRTRRRQSRSSDNRKSRSKSVDKRESSVRTRRRRSRSSDHKSRSKSVDKRETSVRAKRRSGSSDNRKSRSKSVDKRETSARAKSRRSRSSDNRKSRSKSVDKKETSARAKSRRSRSSDNRKSRSKSVDKKEASARAKSRRSRSTDNRKSRSKSFDNRETSARSKRKRSRSSENCKSRSKSVDKIEVSSTSKRRRSKSSDHKSVTKSSEKKESSLKSRHRRSKSSDRQKSKSKSRSKSSERRKDKESSNASKEKCSKSRSKSKSPEKTVGVESLEASVCNLEKLPEHPKSKSRSKSRSLDKTEDRDRLRRSRSKCSEPKSHSHRTVSHSRRNCSRSLTRKRTSRSKSDHRSRSRSRTRSRSCSKRWRRTRSRSVSRQRSLSRERRRRSRRNRSRSVDRRRRRSDSRDSYRITLRLRSRSRTPVRLGTSRSTGRRRSSSVSPDHRRSRSSSRSPKRLTDLDKAQLLEIAKANAAAMCAKAGVPLPPSLMPVVTPEKKEEKVTQKSAKETIMELTEKCKKIAQSQEDDVIINKPHVSDEEEEEHPFINHPFKLNEPKPIFFNLTTPTIKPAPPKNQVTLTKEFPVSSGSQHRKKEADSAYGEWVPVEKNKEENKDDVFPNPATLEPVDISSALNERTLAQKRLTENTFDLEAMCLLNRAQERIDAWAQLNSLPGQFTGSTGAQVLSSEQLSNSGPQAWIKKVDDIQTDESQYHRLSSFEITGRSDDTLRTLIAS